MPLVAGRSNMHPFMNASMQLAASAFFVLSYEAEAQIAPTTHFGAGIYTGASVPLADFTDSAKAGYHVGGTVDRTVNKFLDLRIDVAFNKLSDKTLSEGTTFREVGTNLLFGTLGAKVHPVRDAPSARGGSRISPYLLVGVGIYWFHFDFVCRGLACTGPEREGQSATNLGFNASAGAIGRVRGVRPFFQVGYHAIVSNGRQNDHNALMLASLGLQLR